MQPRGAAIWPTSPLRGIALTVATRHDYRKWLGPIASFVVLTLALIALTRLTHSLRLRDILDQFYAIPWSTLLLSGALAATSYFILTIVEVLAVRNAGRSLGYARTALTAFVAYAIGHNVGLAALSGGAVRYRSYSLLGLSASEIAQVIAFSTLTFALGAGTLLGITLVSSAPRSAVILHVDEAFVLALGALILAAIAAYVTLTIVRKAPFEIRGWQVKLPSPGTTVAQLLLSALDLTVVRPWRVRIRAADPHSRRHRPFDGRCAARVPLHLLRDAVSACGDGHDRT